VRANNRLLKSKNRLIDLQAQTIEAQAQTIEVLKSGTVEQIASDLRQRRAADAESPSRWIN
jgi:hypothetical protein